MQSTVAVIGRFLDRHTRSLQAGVPAAGAAIPGAMLGWLAWSPAGAIWALLGVPLLWASMPTRRAAFWALLGYYLAGARDVPVMVMRFFPGSGLAFAVTIWELHAAILALAWALAWPRRENPAKAVLWRFLGLTAVLVLPPFGSLAWLSPHQIAGRLYPGWGFLGAGLAVLIMAIIAIASRTRTRPVIASLAALGMLGAIANLTYDNQMPPAGWVAVDTKLGIFPKDRTAGFERQQKLIAVVRDRLDAGATVVVLPEEVAGEWRPAVQYWWNSIDELARRRGATVLVGADVVDGSHYRDALVVLGRGAGKQVSSRQPIPVGLWRPWSGEGAMAEWNQPGVVLLGGRVAAVSICYEDLLLWPLLVSMWHHPTVVISSANSWFSDGLDVPYIQFTSVALTARLFGVPLVRSQNL